jgi:transketolase
MNKIDMRDAFFEKLVEAARTDERIIVLSADHGAFALKKFEEEMPSRYINMGIAEQNMVGVAAGLAASGKIVFIYGITPFVSLRVLEQLTIDVAAMQLPVNVISVGAGFTYSTDGPTHQGLQDVAAIATIPGMTILNSSDPENTKAFVALAIENKRPHYIRIEKEKLSTLPRKENIQEAVSLGYSKFMRPDSSLLIITSGIFTQSTLQLADSLNLDFGLTVSIIDVHQLKPFPDLSTILNGYKSVIVFEESYRSLLGYEIANLIANKSIKAQLKILDAGENMYFQGSDRNSMLEIAEISPNYFAKFVSQFTETKLGN